ncbi:MAG: hypothetical protein IKT66_07705 [Alistipes sp.]|nr:hypothetical protein [Alistipes sp.]
MKKLFALAALVLGLASCQTEPEGFGVVTGGEIDTVVTVSLPEATRGSEDSGLANLAQAATNDFDLRYILEVYDVNSDNTPCVLREIKKAEVNVKEIAFPVRLIAGRAYKFVVWADFIENVDNVEDAEDLYYNTENGLNKVTVIDNAWTAMTEARDAYTSFVDVPNYSGTQPINLELTRPFGKLRVVTTDIDALRYIQALPTAVECQYAAEVYTSFNALNGKAYKKALKTFQSYDVTANVYDEDLVNGKQQTLFADYLFVGAEQTLTTKFHMYVAHAYGEKKTEYSFVNDAPIVRNQLTTIIGSILTDANNVEVKIEDEFATKETIEVVKVSTAEELNEALADPEVGMVVMQSDIETEGFVFAAPATTSRAAVTYAGRDVIIDGNGNTLTYKGANGGRIIDFKSETNGANLTIQNLTIINNVSWIERAVNYNTNGTLTLENVTIKSAEGCSLNYAINLPSSSDNAKVEIKNCEIWAGAQALNLWGEKTVANVTNSDLYVVDDSAAEGRSVVAINNDGETTADYSVLNFIGGSINVRYVGEGETKPSFAIRNNTANSTINVSDETTVDGEISNPVAIIYWEGSNQYYSSSDLNAALAAVPEYKATGVRMIRSINNHPVNTTAPYGNYYGVKHDGVLFDGNGNTLDFEMGELKNGKADNYGIMTSGGTIKNMSISGVFRAIMIMNPTEDIYIDNVVIADEDDWGVCYPINTGEGDGTKDLYISNCTLKGWTSIGDAVKYVEFTNCKFGQGLYYTNVYGRLVKPYVNAVFENCEFESLFYIDLSALIDNNTVTLKNCTVNGVKLTAENWTSLVADEDNCGEGQISIELKNGSYMTADNVADYVIFE